MINLRMDGAIRLDFWFSSPRADCLSQSFSLEVFKHKSFFVNIFGKSQHVSNLVTQFVFKCHYLCMCICVCVFLYVYLCMRICVYVFLYVCVYLFKFCCVFVFVSLCMCILYAFLHFSCMFLVKVEEMLEVWFALAPK